MQTPERRMEATIVKLRNDYEGLRTEYQICRRKLDSKCEALLILSKDLDQIRQERDQFKLMAEQVQERYQALKRQLAGVGPRKIPLDGMMFNEKSSQNLAHLLCEMREVNKELQFEVDDYKQKLHDAQGDIKLLREQIARQRVGTTDEGMNTRHFPAHEREDLVRQLEAAGEQFCQLERDLQQCLDEKEDLVTERDVHKTKYERLNKELNLMMKGDENRLIDIDALNMENKYLKDRLKQMEEEKAIAHATAAKYKSILEKKKNKGMAKLGQNRAGGVVITQKQVQQLLEAKTQLTATPQMVADLQALSGALLETVHDKNLALSHQRKTNKILGNRVAELEKKLKTLEVSGLWSLPGMTTSPCLEKLKQECEEIKTLIPDSQSQDDSRTRVDPELVAPSEDAPSPIESPDVSSQHTHSKPTQNAGLSLEDLDLLPTKEAAHTLATGGEPMLSPVSETESEASLLSPTSDAPHDLTQEEQEEQEEVEHDGSDDMDDLEPELQALMENATAKFALQAKKTIEQDSITGKEESARSQNITSPKCTSPLLMKREESTEETQEDEQCKDHLAKAQEILDQLVEGPQTA